MTSLAALHRRADKLAELIATRKARSARYDPNEKFTNLPPVSEWPEFARRTYIRTSGTVAPFDPYEYQIELIKTINESPNTIVNKSRQTGVSETVCSYLLNRALTERGFSAVIFSKSQTDSSELGKRVRQMANSLQDEKIQYLTDSNTQLSFAGRGTLYFLPATARAARGIPSCSVLFLDEAAFLDGAEALYQGAMPTLSMVGEAAKVIVVSTPNTELDWFGLLWHGEEGDWKKVAIHYSQHPVYSKDPGWAEKTRESRRMTVAAFNQEYELQFGQTDAQIYPTKLVESCSTGTWQECGLMGRTYVMSVDPNAGGNDYWVTLVMDLTEDPAQVVAMFRANGQTTDYCLKKTEELIDNFYPERLIVEKNGIGTPISEALTLNFPATYVEQFSTSRPSKTIATDRILYLMECGRLIFPPGIIAQELKSFRQYEGGNREASPGFHDDTTMALAFGCSLIADTPQTAAFFANI